MTAAAALMTACVALPAAAFVTAWAPQARA